MFFSQNLFAVGKKKNNNDWFVFQLWSKDKDFIEMEKLKSEEKKTGHFLHSVAHQTSILALKLIKRGPNEMS